MIPEWIDIVLTHLSDRGQTNCKLNVVKCNIIYIK